MHLEQVYCNVEILVSFLLTVHVQCLRFLRFSDDIVNLTLDDFVVKPSVDIGDPVLGAMVSRDQVPIDKPSVIQQHELMVLMSPGEGGKLFFQVK